MSLSLKETIDRANADGVKYLLTISTEDKSFDKPHLWQNVVHAVQQPPRHEYRWHSRLGCSIV